MPTSKTEAPKHIHDPNTYGLSHDHDARFSRGERVVKVGILGNVVLAIVKLIVGYYGNSKALIADAVNSISDVVATTFILVSLKVAKKPYDKEHPYGHGKIEAITAIGVGVSIISTGAVILLSAVNILREGVNYQPEVMTLYAAVFTMVVKESLFRYTVSTGKNLGSSAIMASAWDHRSDVIVSFATFIGILGAIMGYAILDPIAACAVAFFVVRVGFKVMMEGVHQTMDVSPPDIVIDQIIETVEEVPGVEHVHDIRARTVGQFMMIDLKIDVDAQASVQKGHDIASEAKSKIKSSMHNVTDVMVHVNPHAHPHTHQHIQQHSTRRNDNDPDAVADHEHDRSGSQVVEAESLGSVDHKAVDPNDGK